MLRRLYDWVLRLAETPYALWALAGVSFIESSVFPITPLVMLAPMVLARPDRAWLIAGVCTIASVAGGWFGYWIGATLFEQIGRPVLEFYGAVGKFDDFAARYNEYGAWAVLFAGVTPFPYKVITIASGATGLDPTIFTVASLAARATQFYLVAALFWWFGPPIRAFVERRLGLVAAASLGVIFLGFVAVKYLA